MLGVLRRRSRAGRRLTPEEALEALRQGRCLYALTGSSCSGPPLSVGLRDSDDVNNVLVCKAHYGRLRKLGGRALADLERCLVEAYRRDTRQNEEAPASPDGSRLVVR